MRGELLGHPASMVAKLLNTGGRSPARPLVSRLIGYDPFISRRHRDLNVDLNGNHTIYFVSKLPAFPVRSQGMVSSKALPSESDLRSRNLPPWSSITEYEIASPNPIPPDFVVKNGSNMRSRSSAGIPGPESSTDKDIDSALKPVVSCSRRALGAA